MSCIVDAMLFTAALCRCVRWRALGAHSGEWFNPETWQHLASWSQRPVTSRLVDRSDGVP